MWRAGVMLVCMSLPALAEAPDSSLFPKQRPQGTPPVDAAPVADVQLPADATSAIDAAAQAALDAVEQAAAEPAPETDATVAGEAAVGAMAASPFPRARPQTAAAAPEAISESEPQPEPEPAAPARRGLFAGLFGAPRPRPDRTEIAAAPRGNGICGNPALTGQSIPSIGSRTNGCGVEDPVQITAVDGVTLSIPATMDCTTANALAVWVDQGLRPAFGDDQVVGLQVAGHYICRTRNHRPGARISEHGRGKAIDISGIVLAGGQVLTVSNNWNRQMRAAYQAGCGIFGTTLGPGSDGYHEDHMHFDTASHRNGPYCR